VPEIKKHGRVNVSFSDPAHQNYVSISGKAEIVSDKTKAKELWNPYLKAWFVFMLFAVVYLFRSSRLQVSKRTR
jgi:general stress protein 26